MWPLFHKVSTGLKICILLDLQYYASGKNCWEFKKNQNKKKIKDKTKRVLPDDPPPEKQHHHEHPTDEQKSDDATHRRKKTGNQ